MSNDQTNIQPSSNRNICEGIFLRLLTIRLQGKGHKLRGATLPMIFINCFKNIKHY